MKNKASSRVLIAEDDYLVAAMVKRLLQEAGHEVVGEAADGHEALEKTAELHPDVVVMDIQMPEMDGIEAARRIQADCPTPVVILTAYETPELVAAASAAGVGAYLVKLPTSREFERAIAIAIARFDDMQELRRLNAELEARNEELDAFAHTVAHDLKNSVTPIMGFADVLLRNMDSMPEEQVRECLNYISLGGRKMWDVIDALLKLAEVRQTDVPVEPLDMGEVIANVQQRLAFALQSSQAELVLPARWPSALGYGAWVEEVWVNYIDNALKYGGRPPRVELGASDLRDGLVRFWVRDNGPGLSPEQQKHDLFAPFKRGERVHAAGSGLGLSIVRRIVEKLGGQVGLECPPGTGCTFWFTLPKW